MQNVNSTIDLDKLKKSLQDEDAQLRIIEGDIHRREADHKRAKDLFEKLDGELKDLIKKRDELKSKREHNEAEIRNLQMSLHEQQKRGGNTPLKF